MALDAVEAFTEKSPGVSEIAQAAAAGDSGAQAAAADIGHSGSGGISRDRGRIRVDGSK
jgi:hypothetical protein